VPGNLAGSEVAVAEQAENLSPSRVGECLVHLLSAHRPSI
jgi:hypothetical protein